VDSSGVAKKDEKSLSFKHRLGTKPLSLNQSVEFTLDGKINKTWKRNFTKKINAQFRRNSTAVLFIDGKRIEHGTGLRDAGSFANEIANILLELRHTHKETFDAVSNRKGKEIAGSIANALA